MAVATLQQICDKIWAYPHRTLRAGALLVPGTLLESLCDESWTEPVRELTYLPDFASGSITQSSLRGTIVRTLP